ncbi:hypothetical protein EX30DRAFT_339125 [Ascodesmis nigricans]|uniref:50S ribosomal protein YmL27 n=1 Tax=Ascodesmis nigricans TaxID=341454 RepID=A0A4S2N1H7_9PEZI|nr:hypothetical protein EX30DRAFT_339125 [Ascodesmis nigricans]
MRATLINLARAPSSIRRLPLTTKMVNGGFYKGNRTGTVGRHTKHGGFVIDWERVRTYVVPDMKGFELTPFVTNKMEPTLGRFPQGEHPIMGSVYLRKWKNENGES